MRGRQVVREGCYQLFIHSTLNSSFGSLKGKQFYVKKCIISLAVNKLLLRNKSEKLRKFILIYQWRELWCAIYVYVKFAYLWFNLYGMELKVNVIITRFFFLIEICFLYPIEHNTFTAGIHLFSTRGFSRFYRLKSDANATI